MSPGRVANAALAAAVFAVAGLAAVDALRGRGGGDPAPATTAENEATTAPESQRLAARLRDARVSGELLVTPPGACRVVTWALPAFERSGTAACEPRRPQLAERPDGARSLVAAAGVLLLLPGCERAACGRVLIPQRALERAARMHPDEPLLARPVRVDVEAVAWLSNARAAVLLDLVPAPGRGGPLGAQTLAFFDGPRLRTTALVRGATSRPLASPNGAYVAFAPGVVVRADGSDIGLPPFLRESRAAAWSPDGRWLALAQRASVILVSTTSLELNDTAGSGVRTIDLPLTAADLDWR